MENHKSVTVSRENFDRIQKLGFASESINDVLGKMLSIAEPQLLEEMERSFQQQKLASKTEK
jgi:hypothetical protein